MPSGNGTVGIPPDLSVVMSVQVDETWRDKKAASIDDLVGEAGGPSTNLRDLAVFYPDVGAIARYPGAINDGAAFDLDVVISHENGSLHRLVRTTCKPLITLIRVTTFTAMLASESGAGLG